MHYNNLINNQLGSRNTLDPLSIYSLSFVKNYEFLICLLLVVRSSCLTVLELFRDDDLSFVCYYYNVLEFKIFDY